MEILIDENAGFCSGVTSAVRMAEEELASSGKLYCLGEIVHNTVELARLKEKGLEIIDYNTFSHLRNTKVLIRAHGEPPNIFDLAGKNNLDLIDTTCPIVTRLQYKVKKACKEAEEQGGSVIIFGKKDHPEVIALSGIAGGRPIIVRTLDDLKDLSLRTPVYLFSQTTMNSEEYQSIETEIRQLISGYGKDSTGMLHAHQTVCGEVSCRLPRIREFANMFDLILFVSGRESSNGRMLFEACKDANPNSWFITDIPELQEVDLKGVESIGISGATSTPPWLLERVKESVAERISKI